MIWGCLTTFGPGAWYKIEGRMDRHLYKFIQSKVLVVHCTLLQLGPSPLISRLWTHIDTGGSLRSQVEHHVRDKFATHILYGRDSFIFFDIFLHIHNR